LAGAVITVPRAIGRRDGADLSKIENEKAVRRVAGGAQGLLRPVRGSSAQAPLYGPVFCGVQKGLSSADPPERGKRRITRSIWPGNSFATLNEPDADYSASELDGEPNQYGQDNYDEDAERDLF
jgi:hypothetical protein